MYFGEIVSGIYDRASKLGYKVMLEVAGTDFLEIKEHPQLFEQKVVDGILFIGANARHRFVADFADNANPFLLVNSYSKEFNLNYVVANYRYGAWQAAKHLVTLGHKRIGFIGGGLPEIPTSQDIFASFNEVLEELVDNQWRPGPANPESAPDGLGGQNSVKIVGQ